MRIIHTADWHLGQTFFGYDRTAEHTRFFDWLKAVVKEKSADLLLVSGDVYDTQNPSAESQRLFYRFIKELNNENPTLQVIIIAGNHDSGARLEAPNPLLDLYNVQVRGYVHRKDDDIDYKRHIIPIKDSAGDLAAYCLAVRYLRQGDFPKADGYSKGVEALYTKLYEAATEMLNTCKSHAGTDIRGAAVPIIAMGHLYANGASVLDDDRTEGIVIGGLDVVEASAFPTGLAYIALGHLHKAQIVGGCNNIRYSGAPLPMSFAERNYRQGVACVEITGNGSGEGGYNVTIDKLAYDSPVSLLRIPNNGYGELKEILDAISLLPDKFFGETDLFAPFLEVRLKFCEHDPAILPAIEKAIENKNVRLARIIQSKQDETDSDDEVTVATVDDLNSIKPLEMMKRIYSRNSAGAQMSESLEKLLCSVMNDVEKEEDGL